MTQEKPVTETNLENICWKDENFIQMFGLNLDNVMEYFARSPFYDPTSIHGQLRMQARFNQMLYNNMTRSNNNMTGVDYDPVISSENPLAFIIYKYYRKAGSQGIDYLGAYYIIEASIYQAPDFYTLISNRIKDSLYYTQKTLHLAQEELSFLPDSGGAWSSMEANVPIDELSSSKTIDLASENINDSDSEENLEQIDSFDQPALHMLRMQNTIAVQSAYDNILQKFTENIIKFPPSSR